MESNSYDIIIVGAGHAGVEAGLASSRLGLRTLMLTLSLDSIAFLACNPSIGGTAKGHLVREIDALGGQMGLNADSTLLQLKMLNCGKGAAVQSLRAQSDKHRYHTVMKTTLENQPNLDIVQGEVSEILTQNGTVAGVKTTENIIYYASAVVVCTGVYLSSDIIRGKYRKNSGPNGFSPANALSHSLAELGMEIRRFKTGTPARIDKNSIDFSKMDIQNGDDNIYPFSFMHNEVRYEQMPCYLTYTNSRTHEIIRENIHLAPMYSGEIKGIGPRYCPSIEDKVVRFADKERHQIFIEPEGRETNEVYIQGMSTSFPPEVQEKMYRSLEGLENAKIMRYAYAIEYDCINPLNLYPTLQFKSIKGLYTAGQINGSSGYEEAGCQGLIAGINAALFVQDKQPLVLTRSQAYIGVLIDDLVTKGTNEPYRIMTSRAEYRLCLRQDNADRRLTPIGREIGLVSDERFAIYNSKLESISELNTLLETRYKPTEISSALSITDGLTSSFTLKELLKRPDVDLTILTKLCGEISKFPPHICEAVQVEIKYSGYLEKQQQMIDKAQKLENTKLSEQIDYREIKGLRIEAQQKLNKIKPQNLGQASRISGVSPADITVLMVYIANGGLH